MRVRTMLYLKDNFDDIWSSWTAKEHGCAYRLWKLARIVEASENGDQSLMEHIRKWLDIIAERGDIAIKILVDRINRLAISSSVSLPGLFTFALKPSVAGVGSPQEVLDLEEHLKNGSDHLAANDPETARDDLLKASRLNARSVQGSFSEVLHEGERIAGITVDSRKGRVAVKFWLKREVPAPLFAVLLPARSDEKPSIARFDMIEGADYLLAEFSDVQSGEFEIII
jgi:hypothetical protein